MPTMTPETAVTVVQAFCNARFRDLDQAAVRIDCVRRGNSITIAERRPPWRSDLGAKWSELKVAQLRHDPSAGTWSLHCRRGNERWARDPNVRPASSVVPLLREIDQDPTAIFWG